MQKSNDKTQGQTQTSARQFRQGRHKPSSSKEITRQLGNLGAVQRVLCVHVQRSHGGVQGEEVKIEVGWRLVMEKQVVQVKDDTKRNS